ncbi:MAG: tetratricopeptide repeat protein [Pseudomonadota bacterium]
MTSRNTMTILFTTLAFLAAGPLARAQDKPPLAVAFDRLMAKEYVVARGIVEPLAADGDADAMHMLGYMEERGLGGEKDLQRALRLYADAAARGSADAQFALGELAFLGDGVKQDLERAAGWFDLASEQGHAQAKSRLGVMYAEGLWVEKSEARALALFNEAAELGDPGAQYNMGVAHLVGRGDFAQDYENAAGWFEKAAAQGSPDAQYNLALLHDSNFLGERDPQKTLKWMRAAADGGLPAAFVAMGLMHHDGRISTGDAATTAQSAADWFEKAARAGEPQGQFFYAVALAGGEGRPSDPTKALFWLKRALKRPEVLSPELRANAEKLKNDVEARIKGVSALRQ